MAGPFVSRCASGADPWRETQGMGKPFLHLSPAACRV
jgi:hypothetical protein